MKARDKIPASRVRELFNLDIETGLLTRRIAPPHHPQRLGEQVGTIRKDGYLEVRIEGRSYLVHRLVWAHVHGEWPKNEIDHINPRKANNRPINLREATRQQNLQNTSARTRNKLGLKGVHFDAESGCYRASIRVGEGKRTHLGRFSTSEEAGAAYQVAASRIAGEYAYVAPDNEPA